MINPVEVRFDRGALFIGIDIRRTVAAVGLNYPPALVAHAWSSKIKNLRDAALAELFACSIDRKPSGGPALNDFIKALPEGSWPRLRFEGGLLSRLDELREPLDVACVWGFGELYMCATQRLHRGLEGLIADVDVVSAARAAKAVWHLQATLGTLIGGSYSMAGGASPSRKNLDRAWRNFERRWAGFGTFPIVWLPNAVEPANPGIPPESLRPRGKTKLRVVPPFGAGDQPTSPAA